MKKVFVVFLLLIICILQLSAQERKTENVIIVTLDGYRWKELFEGADKRILKKDKYISDKSVRETFWDNDLQVRREKLMPFFWNTIAHEGQLYGNRNFKNKVNCKNNHLLSYPGYSEMLVGFPAREVRSNDFELNPNFTVLEYIGNQKLYHEKVAAFATWDAFPYILREDKASIPVNAGIEPAKGKLSTEERRLNDIMADQQKRYDSLTFRYAFEHLKKLRPNVLFVSFDGTDFNAHRGRYDEYLKSANEIDSYIAELWNWIQSDKQYRDHTTLLITTDHGRGCGSNSWVTHSIIAPGSRHIWFAVIGPDTPAFGEMKFKSKYYQEQVAKTIAAFLGLPYQHKQPVGDVVQTMLAVPQTEQGIELSKSQPSDFSNNP
jgi:hypothetical protein